MYLYLLLWLMNVPTSQQLKNCQFFVAGRKTVFQLNAFRNCASIHLALVKCLKDKNLQIGKIAGMGFDGASTKNKNVQFRLYLL